MTVLFIVYPGFLSEPNANTKQNHLYGFGTALLSIALMLQALKTSNRIWKVVYSILSLILTANYLFIYEYMIGFEGTRLLTAWIRPIPDWYHKNSAHLAIRDTLKHLSLMRSVTAGFLYWRIFLFEGARNATDVSKLAGGYFGNLRYMSIRVILETIKDFLDTTIFAWFVMPYRLFSDAPYANLTRAVLIAAVVIALVLLYIYFFKKWWGTNYDETQTPH